MKMATFYSEIKFNWLKNKHTLTNKPIINEKYRNAFFSFRGYTF